MEQEMQEIKRVNNVDYRDRRNSIMNEYILILQHSFLLSDFP